MLDADTYKKAQLKSNNFSYEFSSVLKKNYLEQKLKSIKNEFHKKL